MNYEEKYKEALERAKKMLASKRSVIVEKQALETIFPELAESEDERIRKAIIEHLRQDIELEQILSEEVGSDWIAWLEKQDEKANPYSGISFEYNGHTWGMCARDNGIDILLDKQLFTHLEKLSEQKLTDKFESKFKVGDWLQYRSAEPFLVEEITEQGYINGNSCLPFEWENETHLWTIEDAKEGDVLVASDETLFIFAGTKDNAAYYHYSLCKNGSQEISDGKHAWESANSCHPATKEQHDLLFQKMKEAGYEWDSQNNSLSKI